MPLQKGNVPPTDRLRVNLAGMLVAVVGFLVVTYYLVVALSAQDPLWFLSGFSVLPDRIIVYHEGQQTEMTPGKPGYAELAEAVRASLDSGVVAGSAVGLSQGSLEDAYRLYTTVEVFFARPVKLHATFNTGRPTQMLFPITGRHSDRNLVVLGQGGHYLSNAPVLHTTEPIRSALRRLGYLQ